MQAAIQQIKSAFPSVAVSVIELPKDHNLNTMLVNYGQHGIYKLLQEANVVSDLIHHKQETIINKGDLKPSGDVLQTEQEPKTSLVIYNNQKIGFTGKAGMYHVLGNLPGELSSLNITLQLEEPITNRKHVRKLDLFEQEQIQTYCVELSEGNKINVVETKTLKAEVKQKHEPIIWDKEAKGSIEEFFQVSRGLNMDYVIYVQDSTGDNKSIWACAKEDFTECMFTFSNKCYFGRVQSLDMAIRYGFDDMVKDN